MRGLAGAAAALVALCSASAPAKPVGGRRAGAGVMVGQPTALTGYLSLDERWAADVALGWVSIGYHEIIFHADVVWLFAEIGGRGASVTAPLYLGAGMFILRDFGDWFAGVRVPLGIAFHVPAARLQVFGEVSLQVSVLEGRDVPRTLDTEAAAGVRFFF